MEKEQLRDSVDRELKIHTPSYPLPMELQQMERSETACGYCGVSYLILHEFQRLQERLQEVEEQVEAGRGAVERERAAVEQLEVLRTAQHLWKQRVSALELQVCGAERELGRARADLQSERHRCLRLGSLCSQQRALLREAGSVLQHCGAELCGVREHIRLFSKHWDTSRAQILHYCCTASTERDGLQQEVGRTEAALERLQGEVRELGAGLVAWRLQAQTLESQVQNQEVLQKQNQQACLHVQVLKQEVESLRKELQKSHKERQHTEDLLEAKQKGAEEARACQQQQSEEQSATILRLSLHLREKEESWLSCQRRCESLQQELLAWQQKGAEMTQGLERAKGEREELQTALEITRTQTTTLLQEREALKNARRDELQELESTFRKRLEVVEEQRSKLECVVQQQAENQSLLEEAKKQAALGLHLERQSNLELINKHQTEHQQLQEKFCAAISALEQQVHEREEERRSGHAERQHKVLELQQFREEIASLQEENALLQETVRRECEERAELTATLSEARDQLMKLQRSATDPRGPQGPAQPSLPVLAPGHGHPPGRDTPAGRRIPASWQGASQPTPALPRLDKQRTRSISQGRQRVAVTMGRKDMC